MRLRSDLLLTFFTEITKVALGIAVFKMADIRFGAEGFAAFNLGRRAFSFLLSFSTLGLGVGIARFVALHNGSVQAGRRFFLAGALILLFSSFLLALNMFIFRGPAARLLFGDPKYSSMMIAMALALAGQMLHVALYSYWRGQLKMRPANLLQLINTALIPLLSVVVAFDVAHMFKLQGACTAFVCMAGFFVFSTKSEYRDFKWPSKQDFSILLKYGIQRVPGDLGLAALLALPPFALIHTGGLMEGGAMAFGISIMSMVSTSIAPVGLVMLPKATMLMKENKKQQILHYVKLLSGIAGAVGLMAFLAFYFQGKEIVRLFSETLSQNSLRYVVICQFAGIFYLQFVGLRSFIDAAFFKSHNTTNILISLLLMGIIIGAGILFQRPHQAAIFSFPLACVALSLLSLFRITKLAQ
ncbi:MAG: hypothetical protein NZM15_00190 [Flavobacteriales bacterium]|nr:hypothetical protein [Flavobacteriales bacterium]MDW8431105.1 hypothetical protein [Flavobacteriales bacterium]